MILRISSCNFQFFTDIAAQILVCGFPCIGKRVLKDHTTQFLGQGIFIFSGQLLHVGKVNLCFFPKGHRKCFTGCVHAGHNLGFLNGALREHICFSFEIALIIELFQRTQQAVTGILTKCPLIGLRIDQTIFL